MEKLNISILLSLVFQTPKHFLIKDYDRKMNEKKKKFLITLFYKQKTIILNSVSSNNV